MFKAMYILAGCGRLHYTPGTMMRDHTQRCLKPLQKEMLSPSVPSEGGLHRLRVMEEDRPEKCASWTTRWLKKIRLASKGHLPGPSSSLMRPLN